MALISQFSRISHHTVALSATTSFTGMTFTVPTSEDFTLGGWTIYDLALSEIGVDEFRNKAYIRIGNNINEFNFGTGGTSTTIIQQFTGNTSASCINNLYVSNIYGCSPITIHDSIQSVGSTATGLLSTAFGNSSVAQGDYSHAEGDDTQAIGDSSHAEGYRSIANGLYSHAEGNSTADGDYSHSEGNSSNATGIGSHAEGNSIANGEASHSEGGATSADGDYSHAEGSGTLATGIGSHAEGSITNSVGDYSHAEGSETIATGIASHSEGSSTNAIGDNSHAEGSASQSSGSYSHAEGRSTQSNGEASHSEGNRSIATGNYSHAGGFQSNALNYGEFARSSSNGGNNYGQHGIFTMYGTTTNPGANQMLFGDGTQDILLIDDSAYRFDVKGVAISETGALASFDDSLTLKIESGLITFCPSGNSKTINSVCGGMTGATIQLLTGLTGTTFRARYTSTVTGNTTVNTTFNYTQVYKP